MNEEIDPRAVETGYTTLAIGAGPFKEATKLNELKVAGSSMVPIVDKVRKDGLADSAIKLYEVLLPTYEDGEDKEEGYYYTAIARIDTSDTK